MKKILHSSPEGNELDSLGGAIRLRNVLGRREYWRKF